MLRIQVRGDALDGIGKRELRALYRSYSSATHNKRITYLITGLLDEWGCANREMLQMRIQLGKGPLAIGPDEEDCLNLVLS